MIGLLACMFFMVEACVCFVYMLLCDEELNYRWFLSYMYQRVSCEFILKRLDV